MKSDYKGGRFRSYSSKLPLRSFVPIILMIIFSSFIKSRAEEKDSYYTADVNIR